MSTMSKVPDDHPLMIAWNEYKAGPDFENTKQWATAPKHTEGSLWAAFMAGWYKAVALQAQQPAAPSGEAVATVAGEFSEVRQDGEVYWLQTVLLKQPQQLPFGAPLYTAPPPGAVPEGISDDAIKTIWRAAMTSAHNVCVNRSNRWNDDDGPHDRITEANECAKEIARWLEADEVFITEIRAMLAAAPAPKEDA